MFVLKTIIDKYLHKKDKIYACFVDFKKAFDTVTRPAIYLKLLNMNIGGLFYKLIKDMYSKSNICIKLGQYMTELFSSSVGVKQDDVLTPNLFKIFINDLPDYMLNTVDPIYLNNNRIDCLLYADDVILLSNYNSPEGLQAKLDFLDKFCKEWCMSVNTSKTKIITFNKPGRLIKCNFSLNNQTLECVKHKYLGIYFFCSGSFSEAKNELYKKAVKVLYKLKADILSLNPLPKTSN